MIDPTNPEMVFITEGELYVVGVPELEDVLFHSVQAAHSEFMRVLAWRRERNLLSLSMQTGRRPPHWLRDQLDAWQNAGLKPSVCIHWPDVWPSSLALTLSAGPVDQYWEFDPTECTWSVTKEKLS